MSVTEYRVLKAPIAQVERLMAEAISDGWQPLGAPFAQFPDSTSLYQALIKGTIGGGGGGGPVTIFINDIQGASDTGKALMAAESKEAARSEIGAGTSNLKLGTSPDDAMPGNTLIPKIPGVATESADGLMSSADKQKLGGIAANATANDSDERLRDRASHTGVQPMSSIEGLDSTLSNYESRLAALESGD